MIKAICFDLDGVYFTSESFKKFKQKLIDLGISKEDVDHCLHGDPMSEFKRGEIDEDTFWKNALKYWNKDFTLEEIKDWLSGSYEVNQNVVDTVELVRKSGYKTCVVSNNFVTRVNVLEDKFEFKKNFDVSIFSYQVGILKPSKEIFTKLVKKLGVEPHELVYSDDDEDKIQGALEIGINAFVYKDFEQFKDKLSTFGVIV